MGKIYGQLSMEKRAVIETQLEMGVKPAAIAVAFISPPLRLNRYQAAPCGSVRTACCNS